MKLGIIVNTNESETAWNALRLGNEALAGGNETSMFLLGSGVEIVSINNAGGRVWYRGPQFRAEVNFEGGKIIMESDQPTNLGGGGTRPGPLHYCFFGLAYCYTATFAAMASMMGIELKRLTAKLEGNLNFSRVFGLSTEPVMEEVRIALQVESDASQEKLEEVEKLAYERCPAVFALTEQVKLKTSLEVKK